MHINQESCVECAKIMNKYPGFNDELRTWVTAVQLENSDMHVSCAGRGHVDQEVAFQRGASRAHYGQSSHNYNAAVDLFQLKEGKAVWDKDWFQKVVGTNLYAKLNWYGSTGAKFYELPHVEISDWKNLVLSGKLILVE